MPVIDSTLIPVTISQQIIQAVSEQSVVLTLAQRQPMPTGQVNVPFLKTLPVGGWVTGGAGGHKPQATVEWSANVLTAEEVAAVVAVPQALLDDSGIPLWPHVQQAIVDALAYAVDSAILFGTNAPASFLAGGIYNNGIAVKPGGGGRTVHQPGAAGAQPDVAACVSLAMADVEGDGIMVTGHAADITMRAAFRGLRATTGEPIFVASLTEGQQNALYGLPIAFNGTGAILTNKSALITGNWNLVIVGVRQDITVDTTAEGVITDTTGKVIVNAFQDDQVLMRVYMRLGYVLGRPVTRRLNGPAFPFGFVNLTTPTLLADDEAEEAAAEGSSSSTSKAAAK